MRRRLVHPLTLGLFLGMVFAPLLLSQRQIPPPVYDQVTTAFQQGRLEEAERTLRSALQTHPRDVRALGLLGVILDAQERFEEAEHCYTKALALTPNSAALYNNLGNHYLARRMTQLARAAFQRVVSMDPHHPNANLQLAQLGIQQKDSQAALRFLDHLPATEQMTPAVQLLRAQALYGVGQKKSAETLLAELVRQASGDSRLAFSIGMLFVNWERFEEAEKAFSRALEGAPTNFDILYNLGLAASRAGHLERAEQVFEAALRHRPDDVDCLQSLARVCSQKDRNDLATVLLLRAQRLAPDRPDLLLSLAYTSEKLGFYGDTAWAYDQYLRLRPDDVKARRERGFALARSGKLKDGLRDLQWYVERHPKEAEGLYKLALAEMVEERDKALHHLTQALTNDPGLLPARYARASLHQQEGRGKEALEDLKKVLEGEPANVRALDLLGQSFLLLDQPEEGAKALSRAAELAPQDPAVQIHYSRVLRRLRRKDEADALLVRFRQIRAEDAHPRSRTGLFDYLNLSPREQRTQYVTALQKSVSANPKDANLRVRLGKALLAEGQTYDAVKTFQKIGEITSDGRILAECGRTLVGHQLYEEARPFLETAVRAAPSVAEARLDLALAASHTAGSEAALDVLEQVPADQRKGDYYLLRAQVLDGLGRVKEAAEALNRGFRTAPTRADLYFEAALFLVKHQQYEEAQQLLQQARSFVPEVPELLLTQAVVFELRKRSDKARELLAQMQSRWPEWELPYLIHGIILETHLFSAEAKPILETAIALGAKEAMAYYFLALATQHANPDDAEGVRQAISYAVQLSPEDPYVRSLAGRNALTRRDHAAAIEHLTVALRRKPDLVEAHYALSAAYRGTGDHERSQAELIKAQEAEKAQGGDDSSAVRDLLFTVRPLGQR